MATERVYRIKFKEPPLDNDSRVEFFFSSLSAIYDVFTVEQVGCKVNHLWNIKLSEVGTYANGKCEIIVGELTRKQRQIYHG